VEKKFNSNEWKRDEYLSKISHLYYKEGLKQTFIAEKFNISAPTVSRLIQEALDRGIVEIIIRYPSSTVPNLEEKLVEQLHLKDAYVLEKQNRNYENLVADVSQKAALVLEDYLKDGMKLGISLGMAVAATAKAFNPKKRMRCPVARLQGANENELQEGTDLAQIFSTRLGGEFSNIPSPWIMKKKEARDMILKEPTVDIAMEIAEKSDIALVGIGTMEPSVSTMVRNRLLTERELILLRKSGVVGEICGKHYDANGNLVDVDINDRTVSIDIRHLRRIDPVIGVAASVHKAEAILGAIQGNFIDVLVTDASAAQKILELQNKK